MVQQTHGNHNYLQFLFQVINTWYTHTYLQANTHKPKLQINNILNKRLQKKKRLGTWLRLVITGSLGARQPTSLHQVLNSRLIRDLVSKKVVVFFVDNLKLSSGLHIHRYTQKDFYIIW